MRPLIAVAGAGLLLAACGREEERAPEAPPVLEVPPAASVATPAQAAEAWSLDASATAGTAAVLSYPGGAERLRIACRRSPAELYVEAPTIARIGSEERLTLGAGDELATLVAQVVDAPPEAPLTARGTLPAAWIEAMAAGRPLAVTYGATSLSLPPLPADTRAAFAEACRQALG